jgi:superfamily II DNA/RNA helicase
VEGGILGPGVSYGLLHGRLSAAEKNAALEAFASGETNVLIATTVVEVPSPLALSCSLQEVMPSAHSRLVWTAMT